MNMTTLKKELTTATQDKVIAMGVIGLSIAYVILAYAYSIAVFP